MLDIISIHGYIVDMNDGGLTMEHFLEPPRWVDEKRVAEVMGIAIQTLRNWRFQGTGPAYSKVGRAVRYRLDDVIHFMEERRIKVEN